MARMINITSIAALIAGAGDAVYIAAKGGLFDGSLWIGHYIKPLIIISLLSKALLQWQPDP